MAPRSLRSPPAPPVVATAAEKISPLIRNSAHKKRIHKRCGNCDACKREDCGVCTECVRKKKFGGVGGSKQACVERRCLVLEELRKERKRNRAAGIPIDDDDVDDTPPQKPPPVKRRRSNLKKEASDTTTSNGNGNNVPKELCPLTLQLRAAFPDPPSSLLAQEQIEKAMADAKKNPPATTTAHLNDFKYGLPTPMPVKEMCAGCKSNNAPVHADDPYREVVILLCDGPDCQNEYHLECCIPPLSKIPEGAYFCVDCDPSGSAKVLTKYLDKHDERRFLLNHYAASPAAVSMNSCSQYQFLWAMWKEDLEENADNWTAEKEALGASPTNKGVTYQNVPQSELSRVLEIQHHLEGWPTGKPYSLDELGGLFVGKPIRLYCPKDDNYHSGRIVDYRPIPPSVNPSSIKKSPKSSTVNTTAKIYHPNDEFFATKVEFLVRFLPGGNDHRKVLVTRWIRLEEHSLAVGTHIAWGKFQSKGAVTVNHGSPRGAAAAWTPVLLFLRTSRELMPVLHLLNEKIGEISYHPLSFKKSYTPVKNPSINPCASPSSKMDPKQVWALAKRLGGMSPDGTATEAGKPSESYKLLRVTDETKELWSSTPPSNRIDELRYSLAIAEYREQEACKRWRNLPLKNKFHPKALSSRHEFGAGPVVFQNRPPTKEEEELCPLIRAPGLDRGHLMERLVKRGTVEEATRDAAAGLECWLVP